MPSENFINRLPLKFVTNVLDLCGESGERWLNDLPQIIEHLSGKWKFIAEKPFENLSYNYVAPCRFFDGTEAVLKIALPLNNPEIFNEAEYLKIQDGKGAAKLLQFDENRRAMLLERLKPGGHLREIFAGREQAAAEIAAGLIKKLRREPPAGSDFGLLETWFENFFERAGKTAFPQRYLTKTRAIFYRLTDSSPKFLLHGDLHHENILSAGGGKFSVIDPKGIIGELGFETGAFLKNHAEWLRSKPNLKSKLIEAAAVFSAELKIEPRELYEWSYAQTVLSIWWTFEDGGKLWRNEFWKAEMWERIINEG